MAGRGARAAPEFFRFSLPSCQRPFPGRSPLSLRLVLTAKRPAQHGQLHRRCVCLALGSTRTAPLLPGQGLSFELNGTRADTPHGTADEIRGLMDKPTKYVSSRSEVGRSPSGSRRVRGGDRDESGRGLGRREELTIAFPPLALLALPLCRVCTAMVISTASVTVRACRFGPS